MRYLFKNWYDENTNKISGTPSTELLYKQRFNHENTMHTGLSIQTMKDSHSFELYYVPTNNMLLKQEKICENDRLLCQLVDGLPKAAQRAFLIEQIARELKSTNDVEGVQSSRHEIADSTKKIINQENTEHLRMNSLIRTYLSLQTLDEAALPAEPADIRAYYDLITQSEIHKENLPDGDNFIKYGADVHNSRDRVVHRGQPTEKSITEHIENLLQFMKKEDIPYLVRIAVAHYYFGYIHPFYDGNGRTSRFISSLYLSKRFCVYTAYSLSNGCALNHAKYLKIFNQTNQFSNYGELNYFIDGFFDMIVTGQRTMIEEFSFKNRLLQLTKEKIAQDVWLKEQPLARELVYLFCQALLFGSDDLGFTRDELKDMMTKRSVLTKVPVSHLLNTLTRLEEKQYIQRIKNRPITYKLNMSYLDEQL